MVILCGSQVVYRGSSSAWARSLGEYFVVFVPHVHDDEEEEKGSIKVRSYCAELEQMNRINSWY